MAEVVSHHLTELDIFAAVERDHQPREARYRTTYDDGSAGETVHMLYRDGDAVRSCPLADWPAEQAALAGREAPRQQRAAQRAQIRAAADAHAGKRGLALALPELRDLLLVLLERAGAVDADGAIRPIDEWA